MVRLGADRRTESWTTEPGGHPATLVARLLEHCYLASVRLTADRSRAIGNVTSFESDVWLLSLPGAARGARR